MPKNFSAAGELPSGFRSHISSVDYFFTNFITGSATGLRLIFLDTILFLVPISLPLIFFRLISLRMTHTPHFLSSLHQYIG
jgi:hypothetical protein